MPVTETLPNDLLYPEEYYVKFQRRERNNSPYMLGFMTRYDENDPKFDKRKGTVDRWSSGYGQSDLLQKQALITKNEPMEGFEILHHVGRYSTDNKVWRLKDPRGFELEISTANFDFLLNYCDIVDRKFTGELVWVTRLNGGSNWLVPADHEDLDDIREQSERRREARQTRISLRDINRGDIVLLHDGRKVKYLGGMYYRQNSRYQGTSIEREYLFEVLEGGRVRSSYQGMDGPGLDRKSSINVGKVVEEDPMTKDEAEAYVERLLADDTVTKAYNLQAADTVWSTKGRKDKALGLK